jgi:hypothetical protein
MDRKLDSFGRVKSKHASTVPGAKAKRSDDPLRRTAPYHAAIDRSWSLGISPLLFARCSGGFM